jgi:hypothetical protein
MIDVKMKKTETGKIPGTVTATPDPNQNLKIHATSVPTTVYPNVPKTAQTSKQPENTATDTNM